MNIILDVTRLTRRTLKKEMLTGIDRVSMAYVKHYKNKAQALVRFAGMNVVLSLKNSQKLFNYLINPNNKLSFNKIIILNIFTRNIVKNSVLLNTGHVGLNQNKYQKILKKYNLKPIFFVHDLIPIEYPEYCSQGEDTRHQDKLNYILKYARGIITNSQNTADKLNKYCEANNHLKLPTVVALLAPFNKQDDYTSSMPYVSSSNLLSSVTPPKCLINKPYFVMLSTIESRKNHLLILQIFRALAEKSPSTTPHLFVVGKRGWECEQVFDLLDRSTTLKKVVTELSNCNDAELNHLIKNSQALLFPSFAEGYGLPLIEALALETPVIASNLEVFKEIAGDIPEYIDPLDALSWQKTILEYANNDNTQRKNQISRLKDLQIPSWKDHFQKIDDFILGILHNIH